MDREAMMLSWEVLMYDNYWTTSCSFVLDGILAMVEARQEEWLVNSMNRT